MFSSPIGAFIFLNRDVYEQLDFLTPFSSPIGAFFFLIKVRLQLENRWQKFSSPIGAFIFLMEWYENTNVFRLFVFVPYRGFYFLNSW